MTSATSDIAAAGRLPTSVATDSAAVGRLLASLSAPELLGDLPNLMARIKADETVSVIRPMQVHGAKAMQTSLGVKPGGAAADPLAEMKGHGVFFEEHVILPDAP